MGLIKLRYLIDGGYVYTDVVLLSDTSGVAITSDGVLYVCNVIPTDDPQVYEEGGGELRLGYTNADLRLISLQVYDSLCNMTAFEFIDRYLLPANEETEVTFILR